MIESQKVASIKRAQRLTPESRQLQEKSRRFWKESERVPSQNTYNLTICDNPKFLWFRNAKVGTRSIFSALDEAGIEYTAESLYGCYYFPREYSNYFKFAFVRNPWDRFVSGWINKVVQRNALDLDPETHASMQTLENFIAYCANQDLETCDPHFRHQSRLIDLNEVDFIGRIETFREDIKEVFDTLNLSLKQVPQENKSSSRQHYSAYYSNETMESIAEMYRKDIQLFGYQFERL